MPEWRTVQANIGRMMDIMYAGWSRIGQWVLGAGLTALVALAHAQPVEAGRYLAVHITQVSDPARAEPHLPADSPVRTGSIREDVARYSQERGALRPLPRGESAMQRPPGPSPFRN
jgi:hypothetical protein